MKQLIQSLVSDAVVSVLKQRNVDESPGYQIQVEHTRDSAHGDFACNIAMVLAKQLKTNPRELANNIVELIGPSDILEKTEIAGPGFINFFLKKNAYYSIVATIFEQAEDYGSSDVGEDMPVLLEFVSANPTGPLHIGHGRGAAYGAVVANLLRKVGYQVDCEYYVNDAGRQMDILAVSVWLRYLQLSGTELSFPENAYQGDYVKTIAEDTKGEITNVTIPNINAIDTANAITDPEKRIDALIEVCKQNLGDSDYEKLFNKGLHAILKAIEDDLANFGVEYQNWFSERSLVTTDQVKASLDKLAQTDWTYQKDGATWFASSKLGDEKDRVLVRDNGQTTYFASDVAYHLCKYERGYKKIINIWGADHHGYIARVKASLKALNLDETMLEVLLVQFASLYRGKEKLQMSTRSGEFITLNELQQEVGKDAARFFYILRKSEQHLDFDLELAKSQSNDNPVYYIQYAHARICSVFRQLSEKQLSYDPILDSEALSMLNEKQEYQLLANLARYPEVIQSAALEYEPHQLAYYLKDLANDFHGYYNSSQFIVDDDSLRNARLSLIDVCRIVIQNGLSILGVSAPEKM